MESEAGDRVIDQQENTDIRQGDELELLTEAMSLVLRDSDRIDCQGSQIIDSLALYFSS